MTTLNNTNKELTMKEYLTVAKRLNKFKTARALANALGISDPTISRIKNGEYPITPKLKAKFLEVTGFVLIPPLTPKAVLENEIKNLKDLIRRQSLRINQLEEECLMRKAINISLRHKLKIHADDCQKLLDEFVKLEGGEE